MIAVRLFTFKHNGVTVRLAPGAYGWAKRRQIQVAVTDKSQLFFLLPEEYERYLDWSTFEFSSSVMRDIFQMSLDLVGETGWATVKRYVRPFTVAEKRWLLEAAPLQYTWLVIK